MRHTTWCQKRTLLFTFKQGIKCISHVDPAIIMANCSRCDPSKFNIHLLYAHSNYCVRWRPFFSFFSLCVCCQRAEHCRCCCRCIFTEQYNHFWHFSRSEYIMCGVECESLNKLCVCVCVRLTHASPNGFDVFFCHWIAAGLPLCKYKNAWNSYYSVQTLSRVCTLLNCSLVSHR